MTRYLTRMTRYLTRVEVERLHTLVLDQSGGADGIRDEGGLESALAQPQQTFGGEDLYPELIDKAAALAHDENGTCFKTGTRFAPSAPDHADREGMFQRMWQAR